MEDWGSIIGNGDGVVVFLNEQQVSGATYSDATYQSGLAASLAYDQDSTYKNQGIFPNTLANRFFLLDKIRSNVFRVSDTSTYIYRFNVSHNPTLTAADVMSYMQTNNIAAYLALPNTITLATTGADFLNYFI